MFLIFSASFLEPFRIPVPRGGCPDVCCQPRAGLLSAHAMLWGVVAQRVLPWLCWWWPQPGLLSQGAFMGVERRRAAVTGRTSCSGDFCRAQSSISFGQATASHLVSSLARTERKEFDCSGSEIAQVPVCPFQSLFWKQLLHLQLHTSTVTCFITFSSCSLFPRFTCIIFLDESWFQT